ncbi:MAG: TAXI family TRAP transporter solute-binding subunit [Rhodospirillales bacterium]|nr:TAXI family TRAP transporter solute-binding subunit [Rhodospirillales bacterium]
MGALVKVHRRAVTLGLLGCALESSGVSAQQNVVFFRIGTGGHIGTYFPVGGLIANAISNPPGSRACNDGGSCGVPGMIATAVATDGSVANVAGIASGRMQSAFIQSDIAHWAHTGTGLYDGRPKVEKLRAIANLYPESVHVIARKGSGISTIRDLKGKRVSLDERGSGALVDARLILAAYGLSENDLAAEYLKSRAAGDKLKAGQLDAFFSVSGWPEGGVAELAAAWDIELIPIVGEEAAALINEHSFFSPDAIPGDVYRGVEEARTISVNAIWATSSDVPEQLIYDVTAALWHPATRKLLDSGHAKGRAIKIETAVKGLGIPLHPGADKFYKERQAK